MIHNENVPDSPQNTSFLAHICWDGAQTEVLLGLLVSSSILISIMFDS